MGRGEGAQAGDCGGDGGEGEFDVFGGGEAAEREADAGAGAGGAVKFAREDRETL